MKLPIHPQFKLSPYYHAKEHTTWTTITSVKEKRVVARVVWRVGAMISSPTTENFPVVITYKEAAPYVRKEEIPFDSVQAAINYIETMCTLNAWEET